MVGILALATASLPATENAGPPSVRVENIRRAFHNSEHNAFTDLIRWRGQFWLTFRSCPDGHGVFPTASVIVLASPDAQSWRQVHRFAVPERDPRDPHFLVFRDKLFVYSGTTCAAKKDGKFVYDWNTNYGYGTWTADGATWAAPRPLEGTWGHYIWRAAAHGGKAYLCARRWRDHLPGADRSTMEAALLESDDGLRWRFVSLFQDTRGSETAFIFESDGTLIGVSRVADRSSRGSHESVLLTRSRPPYREWTRQDLPGLLGGPMLARWGSRLVTGGRRTTPQGPRTGVLWLEGDRLVPLAELPSGGDNSYPGFVELAAGRGLVSWYSTHEKNAAGKPITAIYLAELVRHP